MLDEIKGLHSKFFKHSMRVKYTWRRPEYRDWNIEIKTAMFEFYFKRSSLHGVVANVLDYDIIVSKFKLCATVFTFGLILLRKIWNPLFTLQWFKSFQYCSSTRMALALNNNQINSHNNNKYDTDWIPIIFLHHLFIIIIIMSFMEVPVV